jgi:hypothetical protein
LHHVIGRWAARAAALFCLAFAGFQVALALGAPYGHLSWGGSPPVLTPPFRAASAGAAVYLLIAAGVMLARAGDVGPRLPPRVLLGANVVLAIQLALNTAANLSSSSAGERAIMGPFSTLGAVLCLAALLAPMRR